MKPETKSMLKDIFFWLVGIILFGGLFLASITYPFMQIPSALIIAGFGSWFVIRQIKKKIEKHKDIPYDVLRDLHTAEQKVVDAERRYEEHGEPINASSILWEIAKSKSWRNANATTYLGEEPTDTRVAEPIVSGGIIPRQELSDSPIADNPAEPSGNDSEPTGTKGSNRKGFLRGRRKPQRK